MNPVSRGTHRHSSPLLVEQRRKVSTHPRDLSPPPRGPIRHPTSLLRNVEVLGHSEGYVTRQLSACAVLWPRDGRQTLGENDRTKKSPCLCQRPQGRFWPHKMRASGRRARGVRERSLPPSQLFCTSRITSEQCV